MLTSKAADAVGHGSSKWGSREGWWGEGRTWGVAPVYRIWAPLGHPELTEGVLGELGLTRRREGFGEGLVGRAGRASTFTRDWGHRQDACATLRAVMLTAVQSLRREVGI
jgi:hypothetical protein